MLATKGHEIPQQSLPTNKKWNTIISKYCIFFYYIYIDNMVITDSTRSAAKAYKMELIPHKLTSSGWNNIHLSHKASAKI